MLLILDVGGAELLTDCPGGTKDDFEVSPAETYVKLQKKTFLLHEVGIVNKSRKENPRNCLN